MFICGQLLLGWLSFLAGFAEEGRAGGVDGAADGGFASGAGFTFFTVDGDIKREVAGVAVGIEKIAQCGASGFDTFS